MASGLITAWQIEGKNVEVMEDFFFLGSKITGDRDCSYEIRRWLLFGRKWGQSLQCVESRDIPLPTKVHIVKAVVFPAIMSCCESCVIKKGECQRIDAFKLWCWRRPLKVLWTARRSSQAILREINPEYSLEGLILKMKLQYWSPDANRQLIGRVPDSGKDQGQRRRGHQRMRWLDGITGAMNMNLGQLQ